jgi:hypothetical protein
MSYDLEFLLSVQRSLKLERKRAGVSLRNIRRRRACEYYSEERMAGTARPPCSTNHATRRSHRGRRGGDPGRKRKPQREVSSKVGDWGTRALRRGRRASTLTRRIQLALQRLQENRLGRPVQDWQFRYLEGEARVIDTLDRSKFGKFSKCRVNHSDVSLLPADARRRLGTMFGAWMSLANDNRGVTVVSRTNRCAFCDLPSSPGTHHICYGPSAYGSARVGRGFLPNERRVRFRLPQRSGNRLNSPRCKLCGGLMEGSCPKRSWGHVRR